MKFVLRLLVLVVVFMLVAFVLAVGVLCMPIWFPICAIGWATIEPRVFYDLRAYVWEDMILGVWADLNPWTGNGFCEM
ncbi:MAG: hypothetical protein JRJ78_17000 [Deltaproteobacteria bacterium]|nr:hypothetical protein [Deltaproteobacteria bacterium]